MSKLYIKNRYGIVPNDVLNNANISFKAKGLFAFLQSKPDGWKFSVERIALQSKDGKSAITEGLKELEKAGFLRRIPSKNEKGRWSGYDYILSENPFAENPSTENIATISNKDISKKDINIFSKENMAKLNSNFKSTLSRTLSKVKENNNKINNNNILSKDNIAKSETEENFEYKTLEKETNKTDNGQPKKKSTFGDPEVNLIIDTYRKKFGFTPTDRKVRFVAHVIRQNIKSFIKEIAPYRKFTFEEVVEKAFNWYASRDQLKGETLDVVRRKFKMLFEKTLKKAKEVQI